MKALLLLLRNAAKIVGDLRVVDRRRGCQEESRPVLAGHPPVTRDSTAALIVPIRNLFCTVRLDRRSLKMEDK